MDKRTNKIKTVKVVATMKSKERFQFKRGTLTKDIITQNVPRSIKSTVKEKRNIVELLPKEIFLKFDRPLIRLVL